MYIQKKNFSAFYSPIANLKKAEAKEILRSILIEDSGPDTAVKNLDQINQQQDLQFRSAQTVPNPTVPKAAPNTPVQPTLTTPQPTIPTTVAPNATMPANGNLVVDASTASSTPSNKWTISFVNNEKPAQPQPIDPALQVMDPMSNQMREAVEVLEDEVLIPLDFAPEGIKEKLEAEEDEDSDKDKKKDEDDEDYDPLKELEPLDLSSDLQDIVQKAGQGMMPNVVMNNPTFNIFKDGPHGPVSPVTANNRVQRVEDDLEGLSMVGFENDIGSKLLKK